MEKQMGLFDLSDNVFDEMKPEKDPNLLAAFLKSTLLSAFGGKKKGADNDGNMPAAPPSELRVMSVEVPGGLPKWRLRDVMLQWRLRHTAHSRELDAVDWLLGQLDPAGFELLSVKVPEQARLLLLEAMIQYTQKYAELQLDACHATRVQAAAAAIVASLPWRFDGATRRWGRYEQDPRTRLGRPHSPHQRQQQGCGQARHHPGGGMDAPAGSTLALARIWSDIHVV